MIQKRFFSIVAQPYGSELLVVLGHDKKQTLHLVKKKKYSRDMIKMMEEDEFNKEATMFYVDATKKGEYIMVFHVPFKNRKERDELLVHETNHLVHYIATRHGFLEEQEAMAYLQEWIFKELRKLV